MAVITREHVKQALAVLVVVLTVTATVGAADYRRSLDAGPEEIDSPTAADCPSAGSSTADDGDDSGQAGQSAQCTDTVATTGAS